MSNSLLITPVFTCMQKMVKINSTSLQKTMESTYRQKKVKIKPNSLQNAMEITDMLKKVKIQVQLPPRTQWRLLTGRRR